MPISNVQGKHLTGASHEEGRTDDACLNEQLSNSCTHSNPTHYIVGNVRKFDHGPDTKGRSRQDRAIIEAC